MLRWRDLKLDSYSLIFGMEAPRLWTAIIAAQADGE